MSFLSKLKTYFSKEDNKREINLPVKPTPRLRSMKAGTGVRKINLTVLTTIF